MAQLSPRPFRTLRRGARRLLRRFRDPPLQVVYHDGYTSSFPSAPNDPARAERILAFLASEGLVLRRSVHRPQPATVRALRQVHSLEYLESLRSPEALTSVMGVEIVPSQVDRLVAVQRLQTGGTLLAVRLALARRTAVVNLGGGLHHASATRGEGFCLFNDVAVAIATAREEGFAGRVLIVDLDLHDGNGTRSLYRDDPTVHTFSVHARNWEPPEAVESTSIELGSGVGSAAYLEAVREALPPLVQRFRPELVVYLAGCDPAAGDPMGDWKVDAAAMLERDLLVTREVQRAGSPPLVIVLAGGYGPEAWRYTARFLSAFLRRGKPIEPPHGEELTLARYRHLARLFEPAELSGAGADNELGLTEADLYLPAWGAMKETRFLGYYTPMGLELVLERTGFLDRLRDLGYAHPELELQLDDPGGQTVRVHDQAAGREPLVELRLRRDRRLIPGMELLFVEWLLLQHPRGAFGPGRRALPGQTRPGLGLLADVVALLVLACDRLHLDGLAFVPAQYHVAKLGGGFGRFLDAAAAARFEAMSAALADLPLVEATRAVAAGRLIDETTGEVARWEPAPMALAVSERLKSWQEARRDPADGPSPRPRFRLGDPPPSGSPTPRPEGSAL